MSRARPLSGGLFSVEQFDSKTLLSFFKRAKQARLSSLRGKCGILAFFEPSTRTKISFEKAGLDLGLSWIHLDLQSSSLKKKESERDTLKVMAEYSPDLLVLRHARSGMADLTKTWMSCPVINAGDGMREHPTQGLLDAYTLWELAPKKKWKLAFYGDVYRSRVARSDLLAFKNLGYQVFVTRDGTEETERFAKAYRLKMISRAALKGMDAVQALRVQEERGSSVSLPPLDRKTLGEKPYLLHPGPVVYGRDLGFEMATEVSPKNLILTQVKNGMKIRRQLIHDLLQTGRES